MTVQPYALSVSVRDAGCDYKASNHWLPPTESLWPKNAKQIQDLTHICPQRPEPQSAGAPRAGGLWPHHPGRDRADVRRRRPRPMACPSSSASPTTKASWSTGSAGGAHQGCARDHQCRPAMAIPPSPCWTPARRSSHPVIEVHLSNSVRARALSPSFLCQPRAPPASSWAWARKAICAPSMRSPQSSRHKLQ